MIYFRKFNYNQNNYPFRELIEDLYGVKKIEKIHKSKPHLIPTEKIVFPKEVSSKLHKIFFKKLNNDWEEFYKIYKKFILNEISNIVDEPFLYQYMPSYRIQFPKEKAVTKWHFDSDQDHLHPDGEINFCIPLTNMNNTTAVWSETVPGKKDFFPMNAKLGQFYTFNGNKCTHGNKINNTDEVRFSFDFRILPKKFYNNKNYNISLNSKKAFVKNSYYMDVSQIKN